MMSTPEKKIKKKIAAVEDALVSSDLPSIRTAWTTLKPSINELLDELRVPPIHAPSEQWSLALRRQAQEDLNAAIALTDASQKDEIAYNSVVCMLLQMTFEKIGKAQLARSEPAAFVRHRMSHATASRLLETLNLDPDLREIRHNFKRVLPFVKALERAHPALTKHGPHLGGWCQTSRAPES